MSIKRGSRTITCSDVVRFPAATSDDDIGNITEKAVKDALAACRDMVRAAPGWDFAALCVSPTSLPNPGKPDEVRLMIVTVVELYEVGGD